MKIRLVILTLLTCSSPGLLAQEDKSEQDSIIVSQDSILYNTIDQASERNNQDSVKYENIEKISQSSRIGRALHNLLFRRLHREKKPVFSITNQLESQKHKVGTGKIIRNVNILTLDPFGYNIRDTSRHKENLFMKTGNTIHAKTNNPVIRNLLLFSENEFYDSTLVKESERLIRSQNYIRDVYLTVTPVSSDSVDLNLRVQDVWTLLPSARYSPSAAGLGLKDINFAGTGSTLGFNTLWNDMGNYTRLAYLMPNIRNTYTSLNIQYLFSPGGNLEEVYEFDKYFYSPVSSNPDYRFSENSNILRSIEINRPFYSPITRWAGGAFLGQIMTTQMYLDSDSIRMLSGRTNVNDLWVGRSWRIFNESDERITSLVLSGRLIRSATPSRPQEAINADIFNVHNYYFFGLNISSRKYFRDRYIFNYGKIEDVPAGKIAGITVGREFRKQSRLYIGLNGGSGTYYNFGYLSAHLSYGTFYDFSGLNEGILTARFTYFTRLLTAGNWKIRQFIRPSFAIGINKSPEDNQPLQIGIKGFESIESLSPSITVISLQTQSYAPWSLAGFHFGPFLFTQFGILGKNPIGQSGRLYSLFGLGMLIRNDYLMFNTFQISLSFYPYIPDNRYNIFKTNAYKTTDYGFRDFEVSKPGLVE